MLIGDVARRADVKVATIRWYEQIGLLPAVSRMASGRRSYGAADLRRLSFIRHARMLGFSIASVRALLELDDRGDRPCADADRIMREQLVATEEKIRRLIRLRGELRRVTDSCDGASASCRVIEALADRSLCGDAHAN